MTIKLIDFAMIRDLDGKRSLFFFNNNCPKNSDPNINKKPVKIPIIGWIKP
jgi:hypothetical protein